MAKLIKIRKKQAGRAFAGHSSAISVGLARSVRNRPRKGLAAFIRRNYKLLSITAAAVAAGVICLIVFLAGADRTASVPAEASSEAAAAPAETLSGAEELYDYSAVDESVLAGLAGTDESLFSEDEELADALLAEEGLRIGVTIGDLNSQEDETVLNRLEELSSAAEKEKRIYEAYYYNANGNYNQQIQDVRSLINNDVDAIIVGLCDEKSFNMVFMMAAEEGIPVVALDAPGEPGFAVNVAADNQAWGEAYGAFVAQNLPAGSVVSILASESDAADMARQSAISSALVKNAGITAAGTSYANGKQADAKTAMAAFLTSGDVIDGVVTEEGMAEGVLDAFVEAGVLPGVMCGDTTAGFIKKWYALKNGGLDITPASDGKDLNDPEPTPTPLLLLAQPGEMIACAQPAPSSLGAAAFEIALRLAEGRTLKEEGQTFTYRVGTMITDDNLSTYYEQIKDEDDDYVLRDVIDAASVEALFEPAEETGDEAA